MPAMVTNKRLEEIASTEIGMRHHCTEREAQDMAKDLLACRKRLKKLAEEKRDWIFLDEIK